VSGEIERNKGFPAIIVFDHFSSQLFYTIYLTIILFCYSVYLSSEFRNIYYYLFIISVTAIKSSHWLNNEFHAEGEIGNRIAY